MKAKHIFLGVALLVIVAIGGYFAFQKLTYEKEDLPRLAKYAATDNYAVLFKAIQAEPVPAEGWAFIVLGDTRSYYNTAQIVMGAAAAEKPRFILHTGDLVRDGRVEEYVAHHMPLVDQIRPVPVVAVPGNHDNGPNRDFAAFKAIYGDDQYSFDYAGCRFVGFNNSTRWGVTRSHLKFLEQELSKPGADHKFVIFHVPPKNLNIAQDEEEGRGFRKNWNALKSLMAEQKVDTVFMGHVHGFAEAVEDGVKYVIAAGGGQQLATSLPEEGQHHNYVVVHVTPAGIREEVVMLTGEKWERKDI